MAKRTQKRVEPPQEPAHGFRVGDVVVDNVSGAIGGVDALISTHTVTVRVTESAAGISVDTVYTTTAGCLAFA